MRTNRLISQTIAFILIQAFICLDFGWTNAGEEQSTLSPRLNINNLQPVFNTAYRQRAGSGEPRAERLEQKLISENNRQINRPVNIIQAIVNFFRKKIGNWIEGRSEQFIILRSKEKNRTNERIAALKEIKQKYIDRKFIAPTNELKDSADFHYHTIFSDGTKSPAEIVYEAWRKGLAAIAISDHYTFAGVEEALLAGEVLGIRVVPAIETSAYEPELSLIKERFHIISYLPIKTARAWQEWIKRDEIKQFNATIAKFRLKRGRMLDEKIRQATTSGLINETEIEAYLKEKGFAHLNLVGLVNMVKEKLNLNDKNAAYEKLGIDIKDTGVPIDEVLGPLAYAGGVSILAHPVDFGIEIAKGLLPKYKYVQHNGRRLLGLRGLEAYHHRHAPEMAAGFIQVINDLNQGECADFPLFWTVGSDTHDIPGKAGKMAVGRDNIPPAVSKGVINILDAQFARVAEYNEMPFLDFANMDFSAVTAQEIISTLRGDVRMHSILTAGYAEEFIKFVLARAREKEDAAEEFYRRRADIYDTKKMTHKKKIAKWANRAERLGRRGDEILSQNLKLLELEKEIEEYGTPELIDGILLHDIGKVFMPADILNNAKPRLPLYLSRIISTHPELGREILRLLNQLVEIQETAWFHQIHFNQRGGYPLWALGKNKLPLGARIAAIVDSFEAMTSHYRLYRDREPLSVEEAREEVRQLADRGLLDPDLAEIFLAMDLSKMREDVLAGLDKKGIGDDSHCLIEPQRERVGLHYFGIVWQAITKHVIDVLQAKEFFGENAKFMWREEDKSTLLVVPEDVTADRETLLKLYYQHAPPGAERRELTTPAITALKTAQGDIYAFDIAKVFREKKRIEQIEYKDIVNLHKVLLRREMDLRRFAQPVEEAEPKNLAIRKNIFSLTEYKQAKTVMFYVSFGGEVDTRKMIEQALLDGKRVLVPYIKGVRSREMGICEVEGIEELEQKGSQYNLRVPQPKIIRDVPIDEKLDVDLMLVPGVVFDEQGRRIGRGKGFYDNFLGRDEIKKIKKAGVAFEFQILPDIPHQAARDVVMDMVVTENRTIIPDFAIESIPGLPRRARLNPDGFNRSSLRANFPNAKFGMICQQELELLNQPLQPEFTLEETVFALFEQAI